MNDQALERRLSHEARTRRLTTISHPWLTPKSEVTTCRVEVSYSEIRDGQDDYERCGFMLVNVPSMANSENLDHHPASLAQDAATEWLNSEATERGWTYVSVDEVYPA